MKLSTELHAKVTLFEALKICLLNAKLRLLSLLIKMHAFMLYILNEIMLKIYA